VPFSTFLHHACCLRGLSRRFAARVGASVAARRRIVVGCVMHPLYVGYCSWREGHGQHELRDETLVLPLRRFACRWAGPNAQCLFQSFFISISRRPPSRMYHHVRFPPCRKKVGMLLNRIGAVSRSNVRALGLIVMRRFKGIAVAKAC
jgi:hypothetical protein